MARTDPPLERLGPAPASEAAPAASTAHWADLWRARVHGMALALTRDRAAAEDLGQEVFLRALKAPSRPEGEALGSWLYRIAKNAWIDGVRAKGRGGRGAQGTTGAPVERVSEAREPQVGEPPALVAWKALPEDERLVVWLRLMVDVPFREIAMLLDTSKSAVDRTFRRALDRLRQEFAP